MAPRQEQHPSLPSSRLPGLVAWIRHWLGGLLSPSSRGGHRNHWAERTPPRSETQDQKSLPSLFPWAPLVCPGHRGGQPRGQGRSDGEGAQEEVGSWWSMASSSFPSHAKMPTADTLTQDCHRDTAPRAGLREPSVPGGS